MANTLNDLLAALDDSVAMEKSAQENIPDMSELSMDQLIKLAEDEGERAAAEMAAADEARLTDAKKDEQKADDEKAEAKKDNSEAKKDEKDMDKEAFLKKLAEIVVSDNGGSEDDMVNDPAAQMVAMDDVKVKPQPGTTDGVGNLIQTIMNSSEQAASDTDSGVEVGDGDDMAEPEEDQVTKAAALDNLMSAGFSFEEAADMVKAASDAVSKQEVKYSDMDKAAAVGELMSQGIEFGEAVDLVKEASIAGMGRRVARKTAVAVGHAKQAPGKAMNAVSEAGRDQWLQGQKTIAKTMTRAGNPKKGVMNAVKRTVGEARKVVGTLAEDHPGKLMAGAGGAMLAGGALAGYAAARKHEKKAEYTDMDKAAAVGMLMDQGVDFDTAVHAVQEAAEQ